MKNENNTQSRKWLITINNPVEHNFSHARIKSELAELKSLKYWCMSDEIGENNTYHTHIFIHAGSAIRFSTMKKRFVGSHLDMARGTAQECRDYVSKEGKWLNDKKKETNLPETFEEYGELPVERQGSRNDLHDLYDMIKGGLSNYEILEACPDYMFNVDKIERVRQTIKEELYKNVFRQLSVTYISGSTGTGKTRGVMEEYGYSNVYRVTDYQHPFDGYQGQDVVIFEEFRSSLKIQDMLNYLDGYPLVLPCRYANKTACFTKVFIITNIDLSEQYTNCQQEHLETWNALLRRIHLVKIYTKENVYEYNLKNLCYQFIWNIFPEEQKVEKLQNNEQTVANFQ